MKGVPAIQAGVNATPSTTPGFSRVATLPENCTISLPWMMLQPPSHTWKQFLPKGWLKHPSGIILVWAPVFITDQCLPISLEIFQWSLGIIDLKCIVISSTYSHSSIYFKQRFVFNRNNYWLTCYCADEFVKTFQTVFVKSTYVNQPDTAWSQTLGWILYMFYVCLCVRARHAICMFVVTTRDYDTW